MFTKKANNAIMKLVYKAYRQVISTPSCEGRLPIHCLLIHGTFINQTDLATDKLRFILSKCPDCVDIPDYKTTNAYGYSLSKPSFVQRLILNAKPDMDRQLYRELNFSARRMGMFLGFKAKTADNKPCFFEKMQGKNFDTFRVIISFL